MSAYGFNGGKNKVLVMAVEDFSDAVGEIVDPQFAAKQDKHITRSVVLTGGSGWSGPSSGVYTQTVNVTGVTATNTIFVSPDPSTDANYSQFSACGVYASSQQNGQLTFTATAKPSNNLTVNVVILGV